MKLVTLNSGHIMPIIGLGTFKIHGLEAISKSLDAALACGYRAIDTASVYRNEDYIGQCLKSLLPKYGLQRSDIFITSKLGPKDQGSGRCKSALLQSLQKLQCDYLDLYLIHWPGGQGMQPQDPRHRDLRMQSWNDMIELQKEDKIKSIGVSNFLQHHIEDLINQSGHTPAVLQIEHHPHLIQRSLIEFCKDKEIHFQAYSSLGTSNVTENKLLIDPVVKSIADKKSKSTAQILLKWAVQQDIGVIPKSTDPDHIQNNMDIFTWTLTEDEIKTLNSLDTGHHYCWNPEHVT